jgi:hypothetical protein
VVASKNVFFVADPHCGDQLAASRAASSSIRPGRPASSRLGCFPKRDLEPLAGSRPPFPANLPQGGGRSHGKAVEETVARHPKLPPSGRPPAKHGQSQRSAVEGTCPRQGSKPGKAKTSQAAWFTRPDAQAPAWACRPEGRMATTVWEFRSKAWRRKARRAGRSPGKACSRAEGNRSISRSSSLRLGGADV